MTGFEFIRKRLKLPAISLGALMPKPFSRSEEIIVKYDGDLNEIDADTFFNSLLPFTLAIQDLERVLNPDLKVDVRIRTPRRGSFEIAMLFNQSLLETLFSNPIVTIGAIIGIIKGVLEIRKHLKGEPPAKVTQTGSQVKIENSSGNTILVDNRSYMTMRDNESVNDSLDKVFKTLNHDKSIDSFEVQNTRKRKLLSVNRKDFPQVAKNIPIPDDKIKREIVQETLVVLVHPTFEWVVVYIQYTYH